MFFRAGFMLAAFWLVTARGSEMARRIVASISFQWPCLVTEVVLDLVTEFWSWTLVRGLLVLDHPPQSSVLDRDFGVRGGCGPEPSSPSVPGSWILGSRQS